MGVVRVLDTNIVLYMLRGDLAAPLPPLDYAVSVITELELLANDVQLLNLGDVRAQAVPLSV